MFYSRNRLDAIQIRYGADDNGNGELVRQYSLTYAADSTDHIFPNITADGGFRADAVRPYAVDDSDDARLGCMAGALLGCAFPTLRVLRADAVRPYVVDDPDVAVNMVWYDDGFMLIQANFTTQGG